MRKLVLVLSLPLIGAMSVVLGSEIMRLSDPQNFGGFIAVASVLFGVLLGVTFRLLRLRLIKNNDRILILGPNEKLDRNEGAKSSAPPKQDLS